MLTIAVRCHIHHAAIDLQRCTDTWSQVVHSSSYNHHQCHHVSYRCITVHITSHDDTRVLVGRLDNSCCAGMSSSLNTVCICSRRTQIVMIPNTVIIVFSESRRRHEFDQPLIATIAAENGFGRHFYDVLPQNVIMLGKVSSPSPRNTLLRKSVLLRLAICLRNSSKSTKILDSPALHSHISHTSLPHHRSGGSGLDDHSLSGLLLGCCSSM